MVGSGGEDGCRAQTIPRGWEQIWVELTEVRRHKSVGAINEVRVPKTTPSMRNLPPYPSSPKESWVPGTLVPSRGRSAPTFPLHSPTITKFLCSFIHSKILSPHRVPGTVHRAPCHWTTKVQTRETERPTRSQTLWC